jgi:transposase
LGTRGSRKGFWCQDQHRTIHRSSRLRAVRLFRSSGRSFPEIAKELGVSDESSRRWVKQAEIDAGERDGLTTGEREELGRLRRENKVLKQERDFLKKAAAFFAPGRMGHVELFSAHRGEEGEFSRPAHVPHALGVSREAATTTGEAELLLGGRRPMRA